MQAAAFLCGRQMRNSALQNKINRRIEMGWFAWIILGGIAGAIAKWIMPGDGPGGLIVTILIGIAGGLVGGYIGTALGFGSVSGLNIPSLLLAIGGASVLLFLYELINKK
jgi:uncharacterized membrane protein YeaQ/YmgE (transglycosylase-associated protein family)